MRIRFAVLPIVLFALAACATTTRVEPQKKYRVIAYVYGHTDMYAIDAAKLTHINYAFSKVNPLGLADFEEPDAPSHLAQLQALKAVNPDLKLIVSIGGWGADYFSDAALTEASRCNFADSVIEMMKRYALDGIDLDWEYPGQAGPGMIFRPEDKQNFTLLLKTLREELDMLSDVRGRKGLDRYTLSIASAGGSSYFANTEMERLHPYVDWFNVMTYDLAGEWSSTTAHHTALYRSASAPESEASADAYVMQHLRAGIPPSKIVVGAAFYGKSWVRADRANSGLYRTFDRYDDEFPYSTIVRDYLAAPGFQRRWDETARAPYLWNPETGRFITYDDPQSLRAKAAYVREHNLGGIMYWEQSHDVGEALLSAIYFALQ
jgi:chitinase